MLHCDMSDSSGWLSVWWKESKTKIWHAWAGYILKGLIFNLWVNNQKKEQHNPHWKQQLWFILVRIGPMNPVQSCSGSETSSEFVNMPGGMFLPPFPLLCYNKQWHRKMHATKYPIKPHSHKIWFGTVQVGLIHSSPVSSKIGQNAIKICRTITFGSVRYYLEDKFQFHSWSEIWPSSALHQQKFIRNVDQAHDGNRTVNAPPVAK